MNQSRLLSPILLPLCVLSLGLSACHNRGHTHTHTHGEAQGHGDHSDHPEAHGSAKPEGAHAHQHKHSDSTEAAHAAHGHDDAEHGDAEHGDAEHGNAEHGNAEHGNAEHGDAEHGDAEHGGEAIGITRFTERLELFAEHAPAIAGKELAFLAHLTLLDGFRALENGSVTLRLTGPESVEGQVKQTLRPGIFRPTLTAPAPGLYQASLLVSAQDINETISGFQIEVHASAASVTPKAKEHKPHATEPISFLKEQQWQIPFATAFATQGAVVPTLEVAGEVTTPPSGQADVGAAISGRVVATKAGLPRPGQVVKKGQLLATIAPAPASPEEGARAELAVVEAEARVQAARLAVDRAQRLIADRAISQRKVDDAQRELGVAEKAVKAAARARSVFSGAQSGRGGGTYRVTSPIDGVVTSVHATAGKSVTTGELLLRVVNLEELWIRARVPEQQAARLRPDQDAAFKLPGVEAWLPLELTGKKPSASLVNIGRIVDPRSRTVDVIYGLSAPDERLRIGAMLRVAVPAGEPWHGVVVPRAAVLAVEGRSLVYVQVEGETFEERGVRLAPSSGTFVGIVSGVTENERVVTRGANVIRLASRASTAPAHGHVH